MEMMAVPTIARVGAKHVMRKGVEAQYGGSSFQRCVGVSSEDSGPFKWEEVLAERQEL